MSLRLRLSEKEQALKDAMERVKSSNRTKDSMEHFIVSQRELLMSRTKNRTIRHCCMTLQTGHDIYIFIESGHWRSLLR